MFELRTDSLTVWLKSHQFIKIHYTMNLLNTMFRRRGKVSADLAGEVYYIPRIDV